ncbi:MAG: DUF378 domain-containing protein [Candidatus Colwellbacteria bacterium]|nr:DUF378 domain-containing protein [Candidatus Colwellbacteria bacterium]
MLHKITFALMAVGGLNWLLLALTGWEVGQLLSGMESTAAKAVYVLVGLSAIYELVMHGKTCKECGGMGVKQQ